MSRKFPWKTAEKIIDDVKRKIVIPISQSTLSEEDILTFADEEMLVAQVPSVMMYNEEFFVYSLRVPLRTGVNKYPIPARAIGMKTRDIFYCDENGNLSDMTRISPDDKTFYQDGSSAYINSVKSFYLENNNVVLPSNNPNTLTGYLVFSFYLQPNQLVKRNRCAFIDAFSIDVTVDNSKLTDGDTIYINGETYTARTSGAVAKEFNIGLNSSVTAANLAVAVTNMVGSSQGPAVTLTSNNISSILKPKSDKFLDMSQLDIFSRSEGLDVSTNIKVRTAEPIEHNVFSTDVPIDFLELAGGHKTKKIDVNVISVSGSSFEFYYQDVPLDITKGDYICNQFECWIPQIPSDLHVTLVERTGERILSAIGDREGAADIANKIAKNEHNQGILIDNRVEGSPKKIAARRSILQYQRFRRW